MKKLFSVIVIFLATFAYSQKLGVVDTNYILQKLPEYQKAKVRLDKQVKDWELDIQQRQQELQQKKAAFENEKVLLVGEQLREKKEEIEDLEDQLNQLMTVRFGNNGEINKMRVALVQPFQDQIWNAIQTVAEKNNLGIMFDKSNNISVLYLEKRFDYTDQVLDILLKNTKNNK